MTEVFAIPTVWLRSGQRLVADTLLQKVSENDTRMYKFYMDLQSGVERFYINNANV